MRRLFTCADGFRRGGERSLSSRSHSSLALYQLWFLITEQGYAKSVEGVTWEIGEMNEEFHRDIIARVGGYGLMRQKERQ